MKNKSIRIGIVIHLAISILGIIAPSSIAQVRKPEKRPNIILILTDDMGVGDLSCYGGQVLPTPHLDQMAREGILFTQYYSASPICSPSRVGITTGSHPARWQITSYLQTRKGNKACEQADFLTLQAPSMAKLLKASGYKTAHFGKWHMGGGRDVTNAPEISQYGFDAFSSTWESPNPDPLLTSTNWIWADSDSVKRWERTHYFVDKTLDFLQKNPDKPCFINLWPDDVHTPWVPEKDAYASFPDGPEEQRKFKAVMHDYDLQIGRLIEGLKKLGIDQNTLIIFTSDNGALPTFAGKRSTQYRGSKLSLYEGGIRMPFIVRYPQKIKKAAIDSTSVICANDLLPTLCDIAHIKLSNKIDGISRKEVLLGKPSQLARTIYWEYGRNETAFKFPDGADRSPQLAIREGDWKFLMNQDGTRPELYHLKKDVAESKNIAVTHSDIAQKLQLKLLSWWQTLPKLPE